MFFLFVSRTGCVHHADFLDHDGFVLAARKMTNCTRMKLLGKLSFLAPGNHTSGHGAEHVGL